MPAGPLPQKHVPAVVVETVAPESVSVGQDVSYELVVRNEGSVPVWNVRVEDELPAGCRYVASDPQGDHANGRLNWSLGQLDAGGTRRIKVTVRPNEEGELRNRSVVTFAAATQATMRVTRPRMSVSVTAPDVAKAGEEVTFLVKLSNTGSGPATNLIMQAKLSDGLHNPNGSVLELKLPALPAGQSKTIPLRAIATKAGSQMCQLSCAADGATTEPAKTAVTITEPKLSARVLGPAKCLVKAEPVFTIELTNPGTATTDPVTVSAMFPAGFEFLQASDAGVLSSGGKEVTWRLIGISAGAGKAVSLKLRATGPSDAAIKIAAMTAPVETAAPDASSLRNVSSLARGLESKIDHSIKAEGVPALRFEVVDVEDPVEVGKEAIYEIKVMNQGTGPCTNVTLTGYLSEGTSAVSASGHTQVRVSGTQLLFDPIAKLDVKGEVTYRVKVRGNVSGDMKFKVQIACDQIRSPIVKEENTRFYKE